METIVIWLSEEVLLGLLHHGLLSTARSNLHETSILKARTSKLQNDISAGTDK